MSKTVDERVVQMEFDNKQFEQNVQTSMNTLDKLKQALNLDGATKGLENVDRASKRFDLSGIGNAVETVKVKFSAMEVVAITALSNIVNKAIDAGEHIVKSLTIEPIKQGFDEYELKMNSVQTIMASTGEDIKTVNKYLEELNLYADKTIYSFSDMTSNIGKFTNAGVKLDDAVKAIQGISNEAAVSGANANEASRAMYNFAQALSAGYVKLIDWKSIENANMATVEFKQSLLDTALAMGTVVKEGDKYVTTTTDAQGKVSDLFDATHMFNDSLSNQWMTTEVLVQTLNNYSTDIREMTEEEKKAYEEKLKSIGYTEDQIQAIEKLGVKAFDAAQDVKTFSQLMDTLKESVGSGWSQTFEILFGNLEEAKSLWSGIYQVVGAYIDQSAKARNDYLFAWADLGGKEAVLEGLKNIFEGLLSVIRPVSEALKEVFPPMFIGDVVKLSQKFRDFTATLKLSDQSAANLKTTFQGVFSIFHAFGTVISTLVTTFFPTATSGFSGFLDIILSLTARIGIALSTVSKSIETFVTGLSPVLTNIRDFIQGVISAIKEFAATHFGVPDTSALEGFSEKVKTRLEPLSKVGEFVKTIFEKLFQVFKSMIPVLSRIGDIILNTVGKISEGLTNALNGGGFNSLLDLFNGGIMAGIGIAVMKFVKTLTSAGTSLNDILDSLGGEGGFGSRIKNTLDMASEAFSAFTANIKSETLTNIAKAIAILAASLVAISIIDSEKLAGALASISVLMGELYAMMMLLEKSDIANKINAGNMSKLQTAMIKMATAVLILSVALKSVGSLDFNSIIKGLAGIAGLLTEMLAFVYVFDKINLDLVNSEKIKELSSSMLVLSAAIVIMAKALQMMGSMSVEQIAKGLATLGGSLGILVVVFKQLNNVKMKETASSMLVISAALVVLGGALRIMGGMSIESIGKALLVLAGSMAILATVFDSLKDTKMAATAASFLLMADALIILGAALRIMGGMSIEAIGKSLLVLAGSMTILCLAFDSINPEGIIAKAGALAVMSVSLNLLAVAMKILGSMKLEQIVLALGALAGSIAILGVSAAVLSGLIPAMYGLAGAVALLGVGVAACGAGVLALAAGLTALAAAGTATAAAAVAALEIIIVGILNTIANSAEAIARAVKALVLSTVDVIVSCAPAIVEGILVLLDELLKSLAAHTGSIVDSLMTFLIDLINGVGNRLPELIQAAFNLFGQFFKGIIESFKNIDINSLVEAIAAVGLLSGIMVALNAVTALVPGAMMGLLGVGAVVAEIGVIIAALGALKQIPGLQWLIDEGGEFMKSIGTAIGKFVGGIVGGIAEGATATLPKVADNLSQFMTNLKPFIDGAKSLDDKLLDSVRSLADTILILTASNILDGLTSWFTGGSSLTRFGEELAEFGPYFKKYSNDMNGVDPSVIQSSTIAAQALAELANNLPRSGGLADILLGSSSLSQFGEELEKFAPHIKNYASEVAGLNSDAVRASAEAATILSEMASKLPNNGGLASLIFGEKSISNFGEELEKFAPHIAKYAQGVAGLNPDVVQASASAAEALAEMKNKLPSNGGLASLIFGEKSLSKFGEELSKFGPYMAKYAQSIDGINPEVVQSSAAAAQMLVDLSNSLKNTGGLGAIFVGDNDLGKFGLSLQTFGNGFKLYYEQVSEINPDTLHGVIEEIRNLISLVSAVPDISGFVEFSNQMGIIGRRGIDELVKAFTGSVDTVKNAINALFSTAASYISSQNTIITTASKLAGENVCRSIATAIMNSNTSISAAVSQMCNNLINAVRMGLPTTTFVQIGQGTIQSLINGLTSRRSELMSSVREICSEVINGFREYLGTSGSSSPLYEVGQYAALGLAEGIKSKTNEIAQAAIQAAQAAVAAAKNALKERSPSRIFYEMGAFADIGMANGLRDFASVVERSSTGMAESVVDSVKSAIDNISDIAISEISVEPTIRPVMDLTNVQNGASAINSMLSRNYRLNIPNVQSLGVTSRNRVFEDTGSASSTNSPQQIINQNFTQNNYSPKSLSRKEIYRQTRNQFSAMKGATSGYDQIYYSYQ